MSYTSYSALGGCSQPTSASNMRISDAANPPPPPPAFDMIGSTFHSVEELANRVENLVETLLGSDQLETGGEPIPPRSAGLIHGAIDDADRANRRISDAMGALARLEAVIGA